MLPCGMSFGEQRMIKQFEFYVDELFEQGCVGRSGVGEIRLGEKFTLVRQYKKRTLNEFNKLPEIEKERAIDYTVKKIKAFQLEIDFIGDGVAGYIELEGTGEYGPDDVLVKE